jgi:hypothetical protein
VTVQPTPPAGQAPAPVVQAPERRTTAPPPPPPSGAYPGPTTHPCGTPDLFTTGDPDIPGELRCGTCGTHVVPSPKEQTP